jgi:alpha-beta hydrolase superfamily lysophospholipase
MTNFVLVHGAWHWGGCYAKLANALLLRGHNVAMPDLATHGFDPTPVGTVADMAQYTAPARQLIEASSEKVVLVGHSMGGATCTYLGEAMAEKIAALVYLTAFMVPNGKCPNDIIGAPENAGNPKAAELFQLLTPTEQGLQMDMTRPDLAKTAFYADCSDHDIAMSMKNILQIQSFVPFLTPSATTQARFGSLRRVYVECTEDRAIPIETQRSMQAMVPGGEVFTMATSHSPFYAAPEKLADYLSALV